MKNTEDLAGCVPDDLIGWTERQDGEVKRFDGILTGFGVSRDEAEGLIMTARISAGWIKPEDLVADEDDSEADDAAGEEEAEPPARSFENARILT